MLEPQMFPQNAISAVNCQVASAVVAVEAVLGVIPVEIVLSKRPTHGGRVSSSALVRSTCASAR